MKISYNNLKRFKKDLKIVEDLSSDLIMHTAEVEEIISKEKDFEKIVFWKIIKIEKHNDADSLKVCKVDIWEKEDIQIVCGGSNLRENQSVAVAKLWASVLWHWKWERVVMKKTKIRWVESFWMICASEEIWLKKDFPSIEEKEILDLSHIQEKVWTNLAKTLKKDESILEIDNKAINHRPDLFSHIWILREIYAISGEKFDYEYYDNNFSNLKNLKIENKIPKLVKRYIWLKIREVANIESPDYIKEVLEASSCESKWLLIDLSNYSLYFYGQPTHIFDADKIEWNIEIRFAKTWEEILALDDKQYKLNEQDIVIADSKKVIAIAWIIWGKESAVSKNTKNIIIEWANFDHATLRASGKRLWVRTDSLNIFEKDLLPISAKWWVSLIVFELEKAFPNMKKEAWSDCYLEKQKQVEIEYDLYFINKLIWKKYDEKLVLEILNNLWIKKVWKKLIIPKWRKELNFKADIAEEIARIDWYDNIETSVPKIHLWAIIQNNIYKSKKFSKNFFVENNFFDMYTYSFVNEKLVNKCNSTIKNNIRLKNSLSEEATHMKNSLIPNLLLSLEKNKVDFKYLKLFEVEKIFKYTQEKNQISEMYNLSWVITTSKDIIYYDIQNIISKFLTEIWISKYEFKKTTNIPQYAHSTRTADIIARWQKIWIIWEIKPKVASNFSIKSKIWFFEIDLDLISTMINSITKFIELSEFQSSSFDVSFLVSKDFEANILKNTILKTNPQIIQKVELFDIYENKKLWNNRSIAFKVFLQKMDSEITDKQKNEIISKIIEKSEKLWVKHR